MAAKYRHRAGTPRSSRAFSLLELVVVIALIGTLLGIAAVKLLPYIDEAERVAVLRVEGQLRSTLMMEAAERIVRGQSASISALEGTNPVKFLLEPPKNYVGERLQREIEQSPTRRWYFEEDGQRLVYRLGEPYSLSARDEALDDPAFQVRVAFADTNGNGVFDAQREELHGVRLLRVAGAKWLSGMSEEVR